MKPIEAGCMAIVIGCSQPHYQHLVGKVVRVLHYVSKGIIYKDPTLLSRVYSFTDGWLISIVNEQGFHLQADENQLMRIDGEEFEEEQIEEELYDHQSN